MTRSLMSTWPRVLTISRILRCRAESTCRSASARLRVIKKTPTPITGAEISVDLRSAKVYFSVLGDDTEWTDTEKALNRAAGYIQKLVAERIYMRVTPRLTFIPDHTVETAMHLEELIEEYTHHDEDDEVAE